MNLVCLFIKLSLLSIGKSTRIRIYKLYTQYGLWTNNGTNVYCRLLSGNLLEIKRVIYCVLRIDNINLKLLQNYYVWCCTSDYVLFENWIAKIRCGSIMKNFSFINARITSQIVLYRYLEGLKFKKTICIL